MSIEKINMGVRFFDHPVVQQSRSTFADIYQKLMQTFYSVQATFVILSSVHSICVSSTPVVFPATPLDFVMQYPATCIIHCNRFFVHLNLLQNVQCGCTRVPPRASHIQRVDQPLRQVAKGIGLQDGQAGISLRNGQGIGEPGVFTCGSLQHDTRQLGLPPRDGQGIRPGAQRREWVSGFIPPKINQSKLLWGKNDVRTAIQQFYPPPKTFIPSPKQISGYAPGQDLYEGQAIGKYYGRHLKKFKLRYLRGGSSDSDVLRVCFQDGIFGVGGSNSAISGFAKFNRYEGKTMREK